MFTLKRADFSIRPAIRLFDNRAALANGFSPSSCSRRAGIGYRKRNAARVAGARTVDQESVTEAAAMGALVQT